MGTLVCRFFLVAGLLAPFDINAWGRLGELGSLSGRQTSSVGTGMVRQRIHTDLPKVLQHCLAEYRVDTGRTTQQYSENTEERNSNNSRASRPDAYSRAQPLRGLHDTFPHARPDLRGRNRSIPKFSGQGCSSPAVTAIPPASPLDPIAALISGLQNFSLPAPNKPLLPIHERDIYTPTANRNHRRVWSTGQSYPH